VTVWPFLLAGSAICAYWNWKAAIMFALAVGVGQATTRMELPQPYLLAGYTLLAVVASMFVDRYSGFVLAAFGLVIGAHILGAIGHLPKVITGEIMLVAGMLFCGFNGPSGGLWERSSTSVADRHSRSVAGHAASTQGAAMPSRTTD
jgi:hypothetical protein